MRNSYHGLFVSTRERPSDYPARDILEETESDRFRVVYSSSFRRLQQKAQVFSLEDNSAIRSRLSHTIEVSMAGRVLAQNILKGLRGNPGGLSIQALGLESLEQVFINIVETSCLLHDIGNPPFGHFGESAIQMWFKENGEKTYSLACVPNEKSKKLFNDSLIHDFLEFDGNAQGFRIATRLQFSRDEFGLNLTFPQLACHLKYLRAPGDKFVDGKAGYFHSEKKLVEKVWTVLGLETGSRYPLNYVMEASDDLAYFISDIEDGFEKDLFTEDEFKVELIKIWEKEASKKIPSELTWLNEIFSDPLNWPTDKLMKMKRFLAFKIGVSKKINSYVVSTFINDHSAILNGTRESIVKDNSREMLLLECFKKLSKQKIYRAREVDDIELAGHAIIQGLLEHFKPLLKCKRAAIEQIIAGEEDDLLLESKLYRLLPDKHRNAYLSAVKNVDVDESLVDTMEWFFRAHLVVDFISGMTDHFSLKTYQLLTGIRVGP